MSTTQSGQPTSREAHWPTQIRLPGQVDAPEGPVNMIMMYVMHHAFRRDLTAFAEAVPATPVEALDTWRALVERWESFARALHHHHAGEDAGLWPLLLARVDAAGDVEGRATLEAMEAEHAGIDPLLAACAEGFAAMARGGTADDRAALAVRTAAARDDLGRHLAHEETEAIRLVQRHLTDAEWRAVEKEHFQKPASPGELAFMVPWVCVGLPDEVRQQAFAAVGRPFVVLHALTRRRFARRERRAFAHRGAHR
jgi:hemerythrin-like domain-containing protein